jgi:hypothetical protein
MPIKYVIIKELKSGNLKAGGTYPYVLDQENIRWNLFAPLPHVELNKAYAFTYETKGEFSNVIKIEPVVNIFKTQALKDIANRNDIQRNIMMCLAYSKDLAIAQITKSEELYTKAIEMLDWVNKKTDELMPKE